MKILVVVDMQNDFISGSLGTKEAEAIVPGVRKKISEFSGIVIATRDTHGEDYMDTQEGENLPVPHCIRGTEGWEIQNEISRLLEEKQARIIDKPTFGSVELGECVKKICDKEGGIEEIVFVGLCTDICVISNALLIKAYVPEIPVSVDASCCAGVTPESHRRALEAMESCQIKVERQHAEKTE